jgi:hypothetical protein
MQQRYKAANNTTDANEANQKMLTTADYDFHATKTMPTQSIDKPEYGKNMLSLIPMMLSSDDVVYGTGGAMQIGICYERVMDEKGRFTLEVPFHLSISSGAGNDIYSNGSYFSVKSSGPVWNFAPGFKISPRGNFRIFSYAVGPSFIFVGGKQTREENIYDPQTGNYHLVEKSGTNFLYGFMVNNSLDFNPIPHFYLSLELGLGMPYIHTFDGKRDTFNNSNGPIFRFGLKMGYRF